MNFLPPKLVIILLCIFIGSSAHASIDSDCEEMFNDLLKRGPAPGFFFVSDFVSAMHNYDGRNVDIAATYECANCGRLNFTKDKENKLTQCEGCGEGIDPKQDVWVGTMQGREVYHINAVRFAGHQMPPKIIPPVKCDHCGASTNFGTRCEHCNGDLSNLLAPVTWAASREIEVEEAYDEGIALVEPKNIDASTGDVEEETSAEPRSRLWNRRKTMAALGFGFIGIGLATAYLSSESVEALPLNKEIPGKVSHRFWRRMIQINRWDKTQRRWIQHEILSADLDSAGEVPQWPLVPERYQRNSREWQISPLRPEYTLFVEARGDVHKWNNLDELYYQSFNIGQRVTMILTAENAQLRLEKDGK